MPDLLLLLDNKCHKGRVLQGAITKHSNEFELLARAASQ
jgi:hypothetical protein